MLVGEHARPFRVLAWASSEEFRRAFGEAQCGCALQAECAPDQYQAQDKIDAGFLEDARRLQSEWRCSQAGHAPARSPEDLPEAQRAALLSVSALIRAPLPPKCPREILFTEDADWVSLAYWELSKGIQTTYHGGPFGLQRALREVDTAEAERWRHEHPPPPKESE